MANGTEKRKRVKCGIPGCTFNGVNLNRHFKSVHPNLNPAVDKRIAGSGFAPGEKFSSWCQGSLGLRSVAARPSDTAPVQACGTGQAPASSSTNEASRIGDANEEAIEDTVSSASIATSSQAPPGEHQTPLDAIDSTLGCPGESNGRERDAAGQGRKRSDHVEQHVLDSSQVEWLKSIDRKVDECLRASNLIMSMLNRDSASKPSEDVHQQDTIRTLAFRSGRSVEDLVFATKNQLVPVPEQGFLYCKVCVENTDSKRDNQHGIFSYNFAEHGTQFDKVLPTEFKTMRSSVSSHFTGARHQRKQEDEKAEEERREKQKENEKQVSKNVLATGYYVLKKSLPHATFEDLLYLQKTHGVKVGTINHSADFLRRMRSDISDMMRTKLTYFISSQPCVSLCVDKVTIHRRTVDVTAILTLVPNAPKDHMIQSFVIAAPVVKDHSGDGLASEIATSLANVGITHPDAVAAISTDGQYLQNSVPSKLLQIMAAADPCRDVSPSVPALWDTAHLIQLAERDARNSNSWVTDALELITSVTKRHTHGKGLEDLLEMGQAVGVKVRRPKLWSDTRFAAHAANVVNTFLKNQSTMHQILQARVRQGNADRDSVEDLRGLTDPEFNVRAAALHDIYSVIADCSTAQQELQLLPWKRHAAFDVMLEKFDEMAEELTQSVDEDDKLWPTLRPREKTLLPKMAEDIKKFLLDLINKMTARRRGTNAQGRDLGSANRKLNGAMYSIQRIGDLTQLSSLKHESSVQFVTSAVDELVAKKVIPASARVSREAVVAAWLCVREHPNADNESLFKELFSASQRDPLIHQYCSLVARMWLIFPAESVVESMASVIGDVFGAHRQLDHSHATQELMVRWNGPEPVRAGQLLKSLQEQKRYRFERSSGLGALTSVDGTVLHRLSRTKCYRSPVFCSD